MTNKRLLVAAMGTALMTGAGITSVQAFEASANIAIVSDYRFRGISQSDEKAAVQGGFDMSFEPGFYIGTWASSVDFGDGDETGSFGTLEHDYYLGWEGPIGDTEFSIDVGYAYYHYPGDTIDPKGNYQEFHIAPSWNDLVLSIVYSNDYYQETGKFWYYGLEYSYAFTDEFSVGFTVGYNDFDKKEFLGDDADNYTDYSLTFTYTLLGVDLSVAWVGTNLSKSECWDSNLCDDTAVFSISKTF